MKKVIILVFILISITGGFVFYSQSKQDKSELKQVNVNDKKEEIVTDDLQDEEIKSERLSGEKIQDPKKEDVKTEKDIEQTPERKEVQEKKQNDSSKQNKGNTNNNNVQTQEVKQSEPIIEAKKEEVWDKLGMTKDEYYNKPMFSWERVDFKSMNECLSYGDNYEPYLNGEVLYNCRDVLSASGKYLGVMFDTEKVN